MGRAVAIDVDQQQRAGLRRNAAIAPGLGEGDRIGIEELERTGCGRLAHDACHRLDGRGHVAERGAQGA